MLNAWQAGVVIVKLRRVSERHRPRVDSDTIVEVAREAGLRLEPGHLVKSSIVEAKATVGQVLAGCNQPQTPLDVAQARDFLALFPTTTRFYSTFRHGGEPGTLSAYSTGWPVLLNSWELNLFAVYGRGVLLIAVGDEP